MGPTRDAVQGTMWGGAHGYDPAEIDMEALFIAAGPHIKAGPLPRFHNLDVYNFMSAVLGITPAQNDGGSFLVDNVYQPGKSV